MKESHNSIIQSINTCDTHYQSYGLWQMFCFKNSLQPQNEKIWIEQTILSLPQALKYKPFNQRVILADLFYLLENPQSRVYTCDVLTRVIDDIPLWVWILWIPNIFSAILNLKQEKQIFFILLQKISNAYPQLIYYEIKRFLDDSKQDKNVTNLQQIFDVEFKQIKQFLTNKFLHFYESLEKALLLDEPFIILEKCIKNLQNIKNQIYKEQPDEKQAQCQLMEVLNLVLKYQQYLIQPDIKLLNSILVQSKSKLNLASIYTMADSIQKQINIYKKDSYQLNRLNYLEAMHNFPEIEIPGQYKGNREPLNEVFVQIQALDTKIQIIKRNYTYNRIISMKGTDGKFYQFMFQIDNIPTKDFCQKLVNIFDTQHINIINIQNSQQRETVHRNLKISQLNQFYVSSSFCLTQESGSLVCFNDILDNHIEQNQLQLCSLEKRDYHSFKQLICPNILKKFLIKNLGSLENYYVFRKKFTYSYSMSQLYSYLICNNQHLQNMLIDIQSGTFYFSQIERIPTQLINSVKNSQSPFISLRFSRNIKNYITEYGLEGPMKATFIGSLNNLISPEFTYKSYLNVFNSEINRFYLSDVEYSQTNKQSLKQYQKLQGLILNNDTNQKDYESLNLLLDISMNEECFKQIQLEYKYWF